MDVPWFEWGDLSASSGDDDEDDDESGSRADYREWPSAHPNIAVTLTTDDIPPRFDADGLSSDGGMRVSSPRSNDDDGWSRPASGGQKHNHVPIQKPQGHTRSMDAVKQRRPPARNAQDHSHAASESPRSIPRAHQGQTPPQESELQASDNEPGLGFTVNELEASSSDSEGSLYIAPRADKKIDEEKIQKMEDTEGEDDSSSFSEGELCMPSGAEKKMEKKPQKMEDKKEEDDSSSSYSSEGELHMPPRAKKG
ncbi:hypothetical protein CALCODRAFT_505128 [Calocera cornea HHB12733]|uniref:Uncharacterized protein n=1 Tax=Calocera cornea HHB12733 TaxID=1353952 RepID=A0A165C062_9BASI|nr:hypothetical protein CALCODRAFT_505128 [Calocera cornea HHB12733]